MNILEHQLKHLFGFEAEIKIRRIQRLAIQTAIFGDGLFSRIRISKKLRL